MAGKKVNPALSAEFKPSSQLAAVIKTSGSVTRAQAVKKTWEYIKSHNGAQAGRNINPITPELKALLGESSIDMFQLAKIINKNLSK